MSAIKQIRGQIRQIVKEILPEVLKAELVDIVRRQVDARLNHIQSYVETQMTAMNERARDTQDYVVRNLALAQVQQAGAKVEDNTSK